MITTFSGGKFKLKMQKKVTAYVIGFMAWYRVLGGRVADIFNGKFIYEINSNW